MFDHGDSENKTEDTVGCLQNLLFLNIRFYFKLDQISPDRSMI